MDKQESAIVPNQVFSIVALSMVGVRILSLPAEVAQVAGRDAWIATLIAAGITMGEIYLLAQYCRRFPQLYYPQTIYLVYGRWLGRLFTGFIALLLVLVAGVGLRDFSTTMRISILDKTPPWVIWGTMLLVTCYLVQSGLEVIARTFDLLYPLSLIMGLLIAAATVPQMHLRNLLPMLAEEPAQIARGVFVALRAFQQFTVIAVLLPDLRQKQSYLSRVLLATGVTLFLNALGVFNSVTVFGPRETAYLVSPLLSLARSVDIPYAVVERMEILLMVEWVPIGFAQLGIRLYMIELIFSRVWRVPKGWRLPIIVITAAVIALVASLPRDVTLNSRFIDYLDYSVVSVGLIFTPVTYLVAVLTGKRGDHDTKNSARRGA